MMNDSRFVPNLRDRILQVYTSVLGIIGPQWDVFEVYTAEERTVLVYFGETVIGLEIDHVRELEVPLGHTPAVFHHSPVLR